MRRLVLPLLALAALAAPDTAAAQPAPPEAAAPALLGTPYVVREDAHRVTLYLRVDRPLAQRFDGEPLATAVIDDRLASPAPVAGRRPRAAARCYAARAWIDSARPGRLVAVALLVEGAHPATVSALVALRAPRAGDGRGAPLGC